MDKRLRELETIFGERRVKTNEPLQIHTTTKTGGPALYYLEVEKIDDMKKAAEAAKKIHLPLFVFGAGSYIVLPQDGIQGLVVKNNCRYFEVVSFKGKIRNQAIDVDNALVYAESGVIVNQLVRSTIEDGLEGLEYQLGLPGTIGGAIYTNARFIPKKIAVRDMLKSIKILTGDGEIQEVGKEYFDNTNVYDKELIQETKDIILSAVFALTPHDKKILWERGTEAVSYRNEKIGRT